MFTFSVSGVQELDNTLDALPRMLCAQVMNKLQIASDMLVAKISNEKLSGEVLQSRTGRLKDSIGQSSEESNESMSADVFMADDVPYAAIQEYGGITKAHIIAATHGKALAFGWQGKGTFFRYISHPGSVISEHSYLRSALDEMQGTIMQEMAEATSEAIDS